VSQIAQLSKSRVQRSICAAVTRAGSSTNAASIRASYHPVRQRASARSWSRPSGFAICRIVATDTPNAFGATMP
jgi:hypothetical protein